MTRILGIDPGAVSGGCAIVDINSRVDRAHADAGGSAEGSAGRTRRAYRTRPVKEQPND